MTRRSESHSGRGALERRYKTYVHLLRCPCIQIYGFDLANVRAHPAMNSRTSNAQEHAPDSVQNPSVPSSDRALDTQTTYKFHEAHLGSARTIKHQPLLTRPSLPPSICSEGWTARTISLAIRADFVLRPLDELPQGPRVPLCGRPIWLVRHVGVCQVLEIWEEIVEAKAKMGCAASSKVVGECRSPAKTPGVNLCSP